MNSFQAELIGTAMLVLLGNGVVANVVLSETKGNQSGWIVITAGWGLAVFIAVSCVESVSGAHLNPAVTLGLAAAGRFAWNLVPTYLAAQFAGAFTGAVLVYLIYQAHYRVSDDSDAKLGTFCTSPAIRQPLSNLFSEVIGTFVLVFAVLMFAPPEIPSGTDGGSVPFGLGALGALPVGLLVFSIGLSLGGTTGYAINPARDLGPRIAHALIPIPGKRDSDWTYASVPVLGPIVGAFIAAGLARLLA